MAAPTSAISGPTASWSSSMPIRATGLGIEDDQLAVGPEIAEVGAAIQLVVRIDQCLLDAYTLVEDLLEHAEPDLGVGLAFESRGEPISEFRFTGEGAVVAEGEAPSIRKKRLRIRQLNRAEPVRSPEVHEVVGRRNIFELMGGRTVF